MTTERSTEQIATALEKLAARSVCYDAAWPCREKYPQAPDAWCVPCLAREAAARLRELEQQLNDYHERDGRLEYGD